MMALRAKFWLWRFKVSCYFRQVECPYCNQTMSVAKVLTHMGLDYDQDYAKVCSKLDWGVMERRRKQVWQKLASLGVRISLSKKTRNPSNEGVME